MSRSLIQSWQDRLGTSRGSILQLPEASLGTCLWRLMDWIHQNLLYSILHKMISSRGTLNFPNLEPNPTTIRGSRSTLRTKRNVMKFLFRGCNSSLNRMSTSISFSMMVWDAIMWEYLTWLIHWRNTCNSPHKIKSKCWINVPSQNIMRYPRINRNRSSVHLQKWSMVGIFRHPLISRSPGNKRGGPNRY